MSEKSDRLLDALNELPDDKLDAAVDFVPGRNWRKTLAHAAVLTLAVGLTGTWFLSTRGCGGSGGASPPERPYQIYAGPCLPLTLAEDDPEITAWRELTLDFLPTTPQWRQEKPDERVTEEMMDDLQSLYDHWNLGDGSTPHGTVTDLLMIDRYTLTNTGSRDKTVTALYPVPSSLNGAASERPIVWVEGKEAEQNLRLSFYEGPNRAVSPWSGNEVDVGWPDDWEGWAMQLMDGAVLDTALAPFEEPEQIPVTVYRFTEPTGPEQTGEAPNPSIRASFRLDDQATAVFPMGFQGMRVDEGTMTAEFSIPEPGEAWEEARLLVMGEGIESLTVGGYVTGGTDPETPVLDGCHVNVEKVQSDLYTELCAMLRRQEKLPWMRSLPDPEGYRQLLWKGVQKVLEQPVDLQLTYWLELMDTSRDRKRLIWQETAVTIPAGESVSLTAVTRRNGSFNVGGGDEAYQGYEFLPTMGSGLNFSGQTAVLHDWDMVEIIDQNFGFDLTNEVTEVALDLSEPCCYLTVRIRF